MMRYGSGLIGESIFNLLPYMMECMVLPDDVKDQVIDIVFPSSVNGAVQCIHQGIIECAVPLGVLLIIHSLKVFHSMRDASEERLDVGIPTVVVV